ncbi:TPA: hypothetical protein QCU60_005210 [Bacillus cereus]|nr:hypothetical protein [Bacillus cereus]
MVENVDVPTKKDGFTLALEEMEKQCWFCGVKFTKDLKNKHIFEEVNNMKPRCIECHDNPARQKQFKPTVIKMKSHEFVRDTSIDRITLMGNIEYTKAKYFKRLVEYHDKIETQERYGKREGKIGMNIHLEIYDDSPQNKGKRKVRIDFNPNKLFEDEEKFLKEEFLPCLKHVSPTRIDLAVDVNVDLSEYTIFETTTSRKSHEYKNSHGKRETLYIGSSQSDEQIRAYNKAEERLKELKKMLKDDKENELLQQQIVELENETWWRFEFQWRDEEKWDCLFARKKDEAPKGTPFDNFRIFQFGCENISDIGDRALIKYLEENPQGWDELKNNKRKKKKLKDLMIGAMRLDLTDGFIENFKTKRADLLQEVYSYIECSDRTLKHLKF